MVETIKKLLVNVQQHFTEAEKLQGRANLGCAAVEDIPTDAVKYTEQALTDAQKAQARENINAAENATATQSSNGLMSSEDKTKLDSIQSGAEANVQSDWNQTNSNADDFIKNKPSMVGKVHFLKAVGDELADVRAPYGFWIVDLEKPNPNSPYGYDYAMSTEIMAKLSAGEVFVLSTHSTAPSPEEDLFIMDRAQNQSRDGHPAVRIWFTRMFASGSPEYMYFTTIYTPSMYNENPNIDEPEGRMAILNWRGDQSALSEFRFMPYKELATVATTGDYNDLVNKPIFKVTLTTTFAELEAAITANKIPLLVTASKVVPMCRYAAGTTAWFTDVTMWGNLLSAGAHSYVLTPTGWSEYPESLNENKDIHMPSCVTAKVTTTLQDNYDEWIRIGEFAIGGHGTSGGSIMIGIKRVLSGAVNCVTDSVFRTMNANASGVLDNRFETDAISVPSTGWVLLRMIDQYSGTATVDCTYDISIFETTSTNPSHYNIKIHKLFDGTNSKLYISATESWGSMD